MHAQQLGPAAAAAAAAGHPPLPMLPHPGLPGAPLPPSSAASLLGLSGLGGPHPLAILNAKHDLHRDEKPPGSSSFHFIPPTPHLITIQPTRELIFHVRHSLETQNTLLRPSTIQSLAD
jgi:hypothetical protein